MLKYNQPPYSFISCESFSNIIKYLYSENDFNILLQNRSNIINIFYVFFCSYVMFQTMKDVQQNSFTHSKAAPVMSHHDKSLQRYNLRELLT